MAAGAVVEEHGSSNACFTWFAIISSAGRSVEFDREYQTRLILLRVVVPDS